jgi:hypothetical protein
MRWFLFKKVYLGPTEPIWIVVLVITLVACHFFLAMVNHKYFDSIADSLAFFVGPYEEFIMNNMYSSLHLYCWQAGREPQASQATQDGLIRILLQDAQDGDRPSYKMHVIDAQGCIMGRHCC